MGLPDSACVAFRLSQAVYRPLFEEVWGEGSFEIKFPPETERICATPGGLLSLGGTPRRCRSVSATGPAQASFMTAGRSPSTHSSSPYR